MQFSGNRAMKVADVNFLLSTLSIQEIYNSFVTIVDGIFYLDENNDNYWDIVSRNKTNKSDQEKILKLLSPNGPLMDLILKRLTTDKSIIHYEYPISRLSSYTQHLISSNLAPPFITSRLVSKNHTIPSNVLYLNAFEYFIFSFISYIYHPNVKKRIDWNGTTDSVFCQLALRYFDFFLFHTPESSLLMQLELQFRTKSSLNQSFPRVPLNRLSSLTNSPCEYNRQFRHDNKKVDITELYYTGTFIQTISEFWFNSFIDQSNPLDSSTVFHSSTSLSDAFLHPSVDQVCLSRVFLKYCYHFCFAKTIPALNPDCQVDFDFVTKLNAYRHQLVPQFIVPKVKVYLQSCFRAWPVDLTFKIVMETWLSAVQPWRYVDSYQHASDGVDPALVVNSSTEDWAPFVKDNYELYMAIFLQFVHRIQRMDLSVLRNASMVFRVAKVLGQPLMARNLSLARESLFLGHTDPILADIRCQIGQVFQEIDSVLKRLDDGEKIGAQSWWRTIWNNLNKDLTSNNSQRVASFLKQSRDLLSNLFGVNYDQTFYNNHSQTENRNDFLEHKNKQPQCVFTNRGVELTEFGRFQVLNNLCRLQVKSNIGYYDRPICNNEISALVSFYSRVSKLFCNRYEDQLRQICYRDDFIGRLSRCILIGERRCLNSDDSINEGLELHKWVDAHPIQLPLRSLATKAFLFWFFMLYIVLRFGFGINMVTIICGIALIYFIGIIIKTILTGFE